MEEQLTNKKSVIIGGIVAILVLVGGLYLFKPSILNIFTQPIGIDVERPMVVNEKPIPSDTTDIKSSDRFNIVEGNTQTPLVPKSDGDRVIVSKATFTVIGAFDFSEAEANQWSAKAKLAYVKSLGAVTLDGKSSEWQVIYVSSDKKNKGYEVIIFGDQILSKKEIESNFAGADVADTVRDSDKAIVVLQELPQYSNATLSAINFYYNSDVKGWRYNIVTSSGAVTLPAR